MATPLPDNFNFAQHLCRLNSGRPEALAYLDDAGEICYRDLFERVKRFGSALLDAGVKPGERILLAMPDRIEWPIAFLGALFAGIVPVPVNTLLTSSDYGYLLEHSNAVAVVATTDLLVKVLAAVREAPGTGPRFAVIVGAAPTLPDHVQGASFDNLLARGNPFFSGAATAPGDVAFWLYSSGSTGQPKGVLHTHANLYWTAELYGKPVMGVTAGDRVFSAAKLFFAYGLGNALTFPLSVGGAAILMAERPTPDAVTRHIVRHRATIFCGAPTLYASLVASAHAERPVTLRVCTSAGEALPHEVGTRFREKFGVDILDGLGSTEMLHIFVSNRASDVAYGATGLPVDGYEIQLRDEGGRVIAEGIGDLWVKGPTAALHYWNDEAKTKSTFLDGWVRTGDKYSRRADGRFVYAGRNDDMLKISGQYVSPFEVESTLMQHPSVLESAVIAVADELGIAKCKAYVVLRQGHEANDKAGEELKAFVKGRLAPFKRPHHVEFVSELPKTATGKIQRFRLREQARATK